MARVRAVLLDAYGTLLHLVPPAPVLHRALAEAGYLNPIEAVEKGMTAEIHFYRAHHDRGRDAESLTALRRECADVLAGELPDPPPRGPLTAMLVDALRFQLFDDTVPALDTLDAAGLPIVVASNWDYDLPAELERLGILNRFQAVVTSAEVGVGKPDARVFAEALRRAGVPAEEALHCGDDPVCDLAGALMAGLGAVLIDRDNRHQTLSPRVDTLTELAEVVARDAS
jgi:putative hydrolase of the HAD superfamily